MDTWDMQLKPGIRPGKHGKEPTKTASQESWSRGRLMEPQKIFKSRTNSEFVLEIYILQEFQFWII
jgi:hypothetical protein